MAFRKSKSAEDIIDGNRDMEAVEATRQRLAEETRRKQQEAEEYARKHGLKTPEDFKRHYAEKFEKIGQEKAKPKDNICNCGGLFVERLSYYYEGTQISKDEAIEIFKGLVTKENNKNPVRVERKTVCRLCGNAQPAK